MPEKCRSAPYSDHSVGVQLKCVSLLFDYVGFEMTEGADSLRSAVSLI